MIPKGVLITLRHCFSWLESATHMRREYRRVYGAERGAYEFECWLDSERQQASETARERIMEVRALAIQNGFAPRELIRQYRQYCESN